jgi:AcrR family transcriptional regulator
MPRDAAATRDALISAGRRLLARPGGLATPVKEIVDAAGQRNVSALHYHFGGRRGLVDAILDVQGGSIEERRAAMLQPYGRDLETATLPQLVDAFIAPQAELLGVTEGRQFLSIVSQLVDLFDRWDLAPERTGEHAVRVFRALQERMPPSLNPDVRHERITRFLELVTSALGARARSVEANRPTSLSTADFVANLAAMSLGALSSPPATKGP